VRSYRTISPLPDPFAVKRPAIGGLLSVALSVGSLRLAVSQRRAFAQFGLSSRGLLLQASRDRRCRRLIGL
jgi:hypothetical protein